MRRIRMLVVLGGVLFFTFSTIPWASADCDFGEVELARIICPLGQPGYIYVCQDIHSGIPLVHHHCKIA